jgi:hypothetical protein
MITTDARGWRSACLSSPGLLLTLIAPKCPLCAAAWLSSLGAGSALAAQLAPWLRPAALLGAALALLLLTAALARGRKRVAVCCSAAKSAA